AQAFGAVLRCAENRQTFRCGDSDGRLSHIKELIAWRTHFHASGRRFTHNSSGQSKNPLTAITVSTAEVRVHCEALGDLAGALVVRGARCLARRVLCLADMTAQSAQPE